MKKYLTATICALALTLSANAFAQEVNDNTMPPPPLEHEMHHGEMMKAPKGHMAKELADKLQLTEEQREMAKKIHEQGRKQMKPLMEEAKALHEKMDKLRKENMAEFEKILTPEQKEQFEQMKKEHREKMKNMNGAKFHRGYKPERNDAVEDK